MDDVTHSCVSKSSTHTHARSDLGNFNHHVALLTRCCGKPHLLSLCFGAVDARSSAPGIEIPWMAPPASSSPVPPWERARSPPDPWEAPHGAPSPKPNLGSASSTQPWASPANTGAAASGIHLDIFGDIEAHILSHHGALFQVRRLEIPSLVWQLKSLLDLGAPRVSSGIKAAVTFSPKPPCSQRIHV